MSDFYLAGTRYEHIFASGSYVLINLKVAGHIGESSTMGVISFFWGVLPWTLLWLSHCQGETMHLRHRQRWITIPAKSKISFLSFINFFSKVVITIEVVRLSSAADRKNVDRPCYPHQRHASVTIYRLFPFSDKEEPLVSRLPS
ncbi:MAG: hypothetical protein MRK01_16345 [Candidatus Scalindua sp.]|nr:hypothetical protein [Candidatus Scalindua sp.]